MIKLLLFTSILSKLETRINNPKSNKTLAKLSAITIKKWITIAINISTKNKKTSFSLGKLFGNNFN